MTPATPALRDLARQILLAEASANRLPASPKPAAFGAFEPLRLYLTRYFGLAGYQALLKRALAMATPETPWLRNVSIQPDSSLEIAAHQNIDPIEPAEVVFLTHLLCLLVTFVGEMLTERLMQDIWPTAALNSSLNSPDAHTKAAP